MYAAPPVSVRGTGGRAWCAVQALVPGLGAGVFAAWLLAHAQWSILPALPVALVVAGLAWWRARPLSATVAWDGQAWSLNGEHGCAQVAIDLDRWLLLRWLPLAPGQPRRWPAMSAAEVGAQWPLLRAALYGRAPLADAAVATAAEHHV